MIKNTSLLNDVQKANELKSMHTFDPGMYFYEERYHTDPISIFRAQPAAIIRS